MEEKRSYKGYKVLFVDDEVSILSSLRRGLIDEEYTSIFASSGLEALEIMQKQNISVIVSDMKMPGMDGLTLLREIKLKYPKTVRVVLSGYTQLQQLIATVNQADIFKYITKPWKLEDEFTHIVRQAIDYHILQNERDEFEKALIQQNIAYQNILKRIEDIMDNAKMDKALMIAAGNEIIGNAKNAAVEGMSYIDLKNKLKLGLDLFNEISVAGVGNNEDHTFGEIREFMNALVEGKTNIVSYDIDSNISDDYAFSTGVELIEVILRLCLNSFTADATKNAIKLIVRKEKLKETQVDKEGNPLKDQSFSISLLIMNKSSANTPGIREIADKKTDSILDLYNKTFDRILKMMNGSFSCARVEINLSLIHI